MSADNGTISGMVTKAGGSASSFSPPAVVCSYCTEGAGEARRSVRDVGASSVSEAGGGSYAKTGIRSPYVPSLIGQEVARDGRKRCG